MRFLNAPPIVLQILLGLEGFLYMITGTFLTIFGTPRPTSGYAMGWVDLLFAFVLLVAAWQLPRQIAARSPLPYFALAGILVVLVNISTHLFSEGMSTKGSVGTAIDLLLVAYLWSQVRRLQQRPAAA